MLYPGPTLGKNEYITFPVVPLVYEAPIISLVTLKLVMLIMSTMSSDSLYPSKYILDPKPKTDPIELVGVKSTLKPGAMFSTDFNVLLFACSEIQYSSFTES